MENEEGFMENISILLWILARKFEKKKKNINENFVVSNHLAQKMTMITYLVMVKEEAQ